MSIQLDHRTSEITTAEEVHEVLTRLLNSKHFVNAHQKKKFLSLICDYYVNGRASELNEYRLGYEVFERDEATYNPSADPIVRVVAHDVRKRLEAYYQHEGANDELRLEIPAGSYQPVFTRLVEPKLVEAPTAPRAELGAPSLAVSEAQSVSRSTAGMIGLGLTAVLLAVAVTVLALSNTSLRQQLQANTTTPPLNEQGLVWAPFLKSQVPTLVVLSNPITYRFLNATDPEILSKQSIELPPVQTELLKHRFVVRHNPAPRLVIEPNMYTGMGEAIGLYRITDHFRSAGHNILLKQSRTVSAEDLKSNNVILLGSVWANEWSGKLPVKEDFVYGGNATIENKNPQPNEALEYNRKFDEQTGNLVTDYALITVKPNISEQHRVMVLAGISSEGTEAAAEFVTSKQYLAELNQRLRQLGGAAGPPKYYQVLLEVGVENSIPTTISILSIHELRAAQ